MNVFFSSDLHIGHDNIRRHCNRPFSTVEEMDEALIERWNACVKPEDKVYVIGDFMWRVTPQEAEGIVRKLNGKVHLLPGNHDKMEMLSRVPGIIVEPQILTTQINNRAMVMCHYSLRNWPGRPYRAWHLWGHSHCRLPPYGLSFDVGVDGHEFRPWSFDELAVRFKELEEGDLYE